MKIIKVKNPQEGFEICKKLLYKIVSKNSVLLLSGGSTPKALYEILAREKTLKIGAVALIDERFGEKLHENSNEKMISDAGLIQYFSEQNIRFYPILEDKPMEEITRIMTKPCVIYSIIFPKALEFWGGC